MQYKVVADFAGRTYLCANCNLTYSINNHLKKTKTKKKLLSKCRKN